MTDYKRGSTNVVERVFIQNSSVGTGVGLTGLTAASAGLTAAYGGQNAGAVAITLVSATVGTYTSGGFVEVDSTKMPGVYDIGIPNAAMALTGAFLTIYLQGAGNMTPVALKLGLGAFDPQDAVRQGMTALPNVNAGATGGLPLGDSAGNAVLSTALQQAIAGFVWDVLTAAHTGAGSFGLLVESTAGGGPTLSAIVNGVWDEVITGHTVNNSFAKELAAILTAAATAAGYGAPPSTSAIATAVAAAVPTLAQVVAGVWNELIAGHTTSGSFAAELKTTADNAAASAGYGAPPSTSAIASAVAAAVPTIAAIINGIWNEAISSHTVGGSFAAELASILTHATSADSQSATAVGFGAPPSPSTIAAAVAAAVPTITAIINGVWDSLIVSHTTSGSFSAALASGTATTTVNTLLGTILSGYTTSGSVGAALNNILAASPTLSAIVNGVWDSVVSGHTVNGSFAAELASILSVANSAAGSAATAAGFGAPPAVSAIAAAILRNTSNLLTTDGSGNVTLASAYQGTLVSAIAAALPTVSTIWNELISGHTTTGSFAAELASILSHATAADSQSSTAASQATTAATAATTAAGYGKAPTISQITTALPSLSQIVAALPSLAQLLATPGTPLANDTDGALPANNLVADLLDLPNGVAAGVTLRQALKAIGSVLAGTLTGAGTGTLDFKMIGNTSAGVTVIVDDEGNRSAVSLPT